MVTPSVGAVVLVSFPFSDLSHVKLRPAVVLADVGRNDWILSQITSNPYADEKSIEINENDFSSGTLMRTSYVRPGKLFSCNTSIMVRTVGKLNALKCNTVLEEVIFFFKQGFSDQDTKEKE